MLKSPMYYRLTMLSFKTVLTCLAGCLSIGGCSQEKSYDYRDYEKQTNTVVDPVMRCRNLHGLARANSTLLNGTTLQRQFEYNNIGQDQKEILEYLLKVKFSPMSVACLLTKENGDSFIMFRENVGADIVVGIERISGSAELITIKP